MSLTAGVSGTAVWEFKTAEDGLYAMIGRLHRPRNLTAWIDGAELERHSTLVRHLSYD
jgi:hypothetical protein